MKKNIPSYNNEYTMEIYQGIRGKPFRDFIKGLLLKSSMTPDYIEALLDISTMKKYSTAFTHRSANPENNYEYYEFMGDATLNKAIVWYLRRRFPQLCEPPGVPVLTRLKINLVSEKSFAEFGKTLGFWPYISADVATRQTKMNKVLEDVFEAFFAVTEESIDGIIAEGLGYSFCYDIIASCLDARHISIYYEDLFDSKSRLKEIADLFKELRLTYKSQRGDDSFHNVSISATIDGKIIMLSDASAPRKQHAEQSAANKAIKVLYEYGFYRPVPEAYQRYGLTRIKQIE